MGVGLLDSETYHERRKGWARRGEPAKMGGLDDVLRARVSGFACAHPPPHANDGRPCSLQDKNAHAGARLVR